MWMNIWENRSSLMFGCECYFFHKLIMAMITSKLKMMRHYYYLFVRTIRNCSKRMMSVLSQMEMTIMVTRVLMHGYDALRASGK